LKSYAVSLFRLRFINRINIVVYHPSNIVTTPVKYSHYSFQISVNGLLLLRVRNPRSPLTEILKKIYSGQPRKTWDLLFHDSTIKFWKLCRIIRLG
jgi:hypothetical protein